MIRPAFRDSVARAAMRCALGLLPGDLSEWGRAMLAEFDELGPGHPDSLSWALGCAAGAMRVWATRGGFIYAASASVLVAAAIYLDWHTDSAATSIGFLAAIAAALGFLRPDRIALTFAITGSCLLAAHALSNYTGILWPAYQCRPLDPLDWVIIASVAAPALAATVAGARLGKRWQRLSGPGRFD